MTLQQQTAAAIDTAHARFLEKYAVHPVYGFVYVQDKDAEDPVVLPPGDVFVQSMQWVRPHVCLRCGEDECDDPVCASACKREWGQQAGLLAVQYELIEEARVVRVRQQAREALRTIADALGQSAVECALSDTFVRRLAGCTVGCASQCECRYVRQAAKTMRPSSAIAAKKRVKKHRLYSVFDRLIQTL